MVSRCLLFQNLSNSLRRIFLALIIIYHTSLVFKNKDITCIKLGTDLFLRKRGIAHTVVVHGWDTRACI